MIIHMFHHFEPINGNPQYYVDHGIPSIGKTDYNKVFKTYNTNLCAPIIDLKGVEKENNLGTVMFDWNPLLLTEVGNLGVKDEGPQEMDIFQFAPPYNLESI